MTAGDHIDPSARAAGAPAAVRSESVVGLEALLDALGLHTVTPAGLEADDVNASGATWAEANGWDCVIITSDRDAFAHISEHTKVLRLIDGGIAGSPLLDPRRLHLMYGVHAHAYLDYAALRGDAGAVTSS